MKPRDAKTRPSDKIPNSHSFKQADEDFEHDGTAQGWQRRVPPHAGEKTCCLD